MICPEFGDGTAACTILPKGSQILLPPVGETTPLGVVTGIGSDGRIVKRSYRPLPKGVDVKGQVVIHTFFLVPSQ